MIGEIEIVHVNIQARTVRTVFLLGVLEQESRFSNTSCSLDANQPILPVNLIHQDTSDGSLYVFHEILMCPVKSFHFFTYNLDAKIQKLFHFAKWSLQNYPNTP